jgi:Tfp pilus assembly PilM family ATPase
MFGLGKAKSLVGLDIGSSAVKAVELRKKGSSYELVNLGMEPLGPGYGGGWRHHGCSLGIFRH